MATFDNTANLNRFVSPMLIKSINQRLKDNFTKLFGKVPTGARSAKGVDLNMIINDFGFETGVGSDDKFGNDPIAVADKSGIVPWENYTSKVYRVSEADMRKLTYAKESEVRSAMEEALAEMLALTALHNIAPDKEATGTPVIAGSGAAKSATSKRVTKKDILALKERYKGKDNTLVLCKAHLVDLLNDDLDSGDHQVLANLKEGTVTRLFGLNIITNDELDIRYTESGNKRVLTAAVDAKDKQASVLIEKSNTLFHHNKVMFSYKNVSDDVEYKIPHSRLRVYGEFIGKAIQEDKYRAAIIDGKV